MKQFLILSVMTVIFSFQFVCGEFEISNTGPAFEIRDGNCTDVLVTDIVYQDHVHKYSIPNETRDGESYWSGEKTIYCVEALSLQLPSENSTVEVTEGGANHTFVRINYKSTESHGYEYSLLVFGK